MMLKIEAGKYLVDGTEVCLVDFAFQAANEIERLRSLVEVIITAGQVAVVNAPVRKALNPPSLTGDDITNHIADVTKQIAD